MTTRKFKNKLESAQKDFIDFLKVKEFAIYLSNLLKMKFLRNTNEDNIKQVLRGTLRDRFRSERFSIVITGLKEEFKRKDYYLYLVKIDELLSEDLFNELFLPDNPTDQDANVVKEILKATKYSLASLIDDEVREEYKKDYNSDELNLYKKLLDDLAKLNILGYRLWIRAKPEHKNDFTSLRDQIIAFYEENKDKFEENIFLKENMKTIEQLFKIFQLYVWGKIEIIEYKKKNDLDMKKVLKETSVSGKIAQQINENRNFRDAYESILRDLNKDFKSICNSTR